LIHAQASASAPTGAWNPLREVKHNDARALRACRLSAARTCVLARLAEPVRSRLRIPNPSWKPEGALTDTKELEPEAAEGLNTLYRRYAGWLAGRLRARVGADRAADVVQETYLRAAPYRAADIRHPKSFLLRIALNLVRDESRRLKRQREPSGDFSQDQSESASQAEHLMLKQIILGMPALYREVFVLSRFGGMTYPEIAAARGLNVKTVEWRMSKALEHCVARLDD
jgi:RNA polymerase sigma factor (sigma-70 family)